MQDEDQWGWCRDKIVKTNGSYKPWFPQVIHSLLHVMPSKCALIVPAPPLSMCLSESLFAAVLRQARFLDQGHNFDRPRHFARNTGEHHTFPPICHLRFVRSPPPRPAQLFVASKPSSPQNQLSILPLPSPVCPTPPMLVTILPLAAPHFQDRHPRVSRVRRRLRLPWQPPLSLPFLPSQPSHFLTREFIAP